MGPIGEITLKKKITNKRREANIAYQISFPLGQPLDMLGRYGSLKRKTTKPRTFNKMTLFIFQNSYIVN